MLVSGIKISKSLDFFSGFKQNGSMNDSMTHKESLVTGI